MTKHQLQHMRVNIGLDIESRESVSKLLSGLLADEFVLSLKTRNAHWNVSGPDFYEKHKFFEEQYDEINDLIDDIAERIRALDIPAPATLQEISALTRLKDDIVTSGDSQVFIASLLNDHQSVISLIRNSIRNITESFNDDGTSDFIIGLMTTHEKMAWMLRAHLK